MSAKDEHRFFSVTLKSQDPETYCVEVTSVVRPNLGLAIHCLFWLHTPRLVRTDDAGLKWTCRNCLLAEHRRVKNAQS
jgi:hypothetical protein